MNIVAQKLPSGWTTISLNELIARTESINPSRTPGQKYELWSVPAFEGESPEYVVGAQVGSNKQRVTPGDVLLCKINPRINRVWLVWGKNDFEQIASTEWIVLRYEGLVPKFIMHQLREESFRRRLCANVSGVGGSLTRARPRIVGELELNIAPVNEQKRIVTKIEELQLRSRRAREALETVPDLLEQVRQSLLAAAFRGDLTKEWRKKNSDVEPASELLKRIRAERRRRWEEAELQKLEARGFTDEKLEAEFSKRRKQYKAPTPADTTDLSGLPASWCWAVAEELTPIDAPIIYGILQPGPNIADGIPYVRPTEISDDHIVLDRLRRTSSMIAERYNRSQLKVNDILLSMVGTIGKVAIVPHALEGGNITQSSVRVRADSACALPEYLAWSLRSPFVREQFEKYRLGTAVPRLNVEDVRRLAFPLPPLGEQLQITNIINERLANVVNVRRYVHNLLELITILEESVFRKAFQGELVSQDPNDEPALVLLERIREEKARKAAERETSFERGVEMKLKEDEQRNVLTVLQQAKRAMTPEEIFMACGFDEQSVDIFYEQLRHAVERKQIREIRDGGSITLEMVKT